MKPQTVFLLALIVVSCALHCPAAEPPAKEQNMPTIQLKPVDGDNSPAIVKALEELREKGGRLVLKPGRYICLGGKAHPNGRTHDPSVHIGKLKDITIDGQGATLIGKDIARLFSFFDSENVTVRNLTIDWDPLPHTSGTVVAVQTDTHSYDIKPMVPADATDGRIVQGILAFNSKKHRLADNGWEIYQTQGERDADLTKRQADGSLRIFQKNGTRLPDVGWEVVVRHQVYGFDALVFANCSKVLIEDVTVHAVPGMAVIGWGSRDVTIRRIKVVPSGEGWMSATADAMHFGACRGTITVEESEFAGMGDDAINIHGMYGLATSRVDDRTLAIGRGRMHPYYDKKREIWDAPAPGDVLEYGGGDEPLLAQGQLTVAEAHQDAKQERTIVKFKDVLPANVGENTVLWNLSTSPAVRIGKCYVHSNRARGMLLQTRDVVLDGCRFEDISGAGLQICTDAADWWESLGSRDVTVKNCVFRRCNFGVARRAAALDLFSDLAKGRQSAAGVHQRIKILDSTFEENSGAAINIGSSTDVEVRGNKITHGSTPVVVIMNSRNVTVNGNTGLPEKDGVAIRGKSDQVTVK